MARLGPEAHHTLPQDFAAALGQCVASFGWLEEVLKRTIYALDRARLRQANRLFSGDGPVDAKTLSTITGADIRASRVFQGGLDIDGSRRKDQP